MRIPNAYTKLDRTPATSGPVAGGGAPAGRAKESANKPAASGATSVNVSSRARELAANSEASSAKVASLREQIQGGTFKVDAQAIAAKLVGDDP